MIIYIMTDMEGVAGIDHWDQCYDPDDRSPKYLYGREQLTADAAAAVAGCFDAGATEVRVCDGHGRNNNRGFFRDRFDPRTKFVWIGGIDPTRLEGLDETVTAVIVVGQHAMAGTLNGFIDHTQSPRTLCRFLINGREHGELSQLALYAGTQGVPIVHVSGDEACCAESSRLFPHATTTATKRGTGWATCELYDPEKVRAQLRENVREALKNRAAGVPWRVKPPITVTTEWACSETADALAKVPGVMRLHARIVEWRISNPLDIYSWPGEKWSPR